MDKTSLGVFDGMYQIQGTILGLVIIFRLHLTLWKHKTYHLKDKYLRTLICPQIVNSDVRVTSCTADNGSWEIATRIQGKGT